MKNRASSHLMIILLIAALESLGYLAVYRAALLRGYAPSVASGVRDLLLFVPLGVLLLWLSRAMRYAGQWALYTAAIALFAIGMVVQYRLYSDPEYGAHNKAEARAQKMQTMRERYIAHFYDAEKKMMLGLPPDVTEEQIISRPVRRSDITAVDVLTSSYTWVPLLAFLAFAIAYRLFVDERVLAWAQRNSFSIVLLTLIPLAAAIATSKAGKALGKMTPWEPAKIPFLIGFAGILSAYYRNLAQTYWGLPRARDVIPLIVMALIPFIPFFALKDFGQMLVFSGVYATLYLIAVRRWPQALALVGSVVLAIAILVVGALPRDVQESVPLLPTLAQPVQAVLPDRIKQRFHLWLDGFDPPSPETPWWQRDYQEALAEDPRMRELAAQSPMMRRAVNVDVWFDRLAFQPSQALFGIASGRATGRGLGLGFPEVIPVADSDYIYAAIGEELGLIGGAIVLLLLFVLVSAGIRTAAEARDMFTKLSAAGLTAFIGLQAIVNIGGITRALPMTGITLPFVSHGGFSLITSFAMLGMLMAFSHRNAREAATLPRLVKREKPSVLEAVQ
ncbi:MAG: FtsW/RodA/SpoVE family cell cycle protein [Pyrinomonas methylaliphatogenes]|nr:FtsW/RodA/SpoVE family cell cycle protein [Pyrinomonas methylaliphatogenes]